MRACGCANAPAGDPVRPVWVKLQNSSAAPVLGVTDVTVGREEEIQAARHPPNATVPVYMSPWSPPPSSDARRCIGVVLTPLPVVSGDSRGAFFHELS